MPTSSISNVNVLHQLTGSASLPGSGRGIVPVRSNSSGADQFQLSPTATLLQQFLSQTDDKGDDDNSMSGLELLKQQGELLAGVLQSKLKNFETNLATTMKAEGIDPTQPMSMQQGVDGLLLTNAPSNKEQITKLLGKDTPLSEQFREISQLAELLGSLQLPETYNATASTVAARYAQQSQPPGVAKPAADARFVVSVMQGNASYSFE